MVIEQLKFKQQPPTGSGSPHGALLQLVPDPSHDPSQLLAVVTEHIAYDAWVARGKSAPVIMDSTTIALDPVTSIPGDLNDDGIVGVDDLLILLGDWGPCSGCPADINGDAVVGVDDLLIMLSHFS